jgi:CRP-like cAMP-binding protein
MAETTVPSGEANQLLAALPAAAYRRLTPDLEQVALSQGQVLFETGKPLRAVYFPDSGLVSVLVPFDGAKVAEVAVVGREGMVGLPAFFGADVHPHRVTVQAAGSARRLPIEAFRVVVRRTPPLADRLLHYADSFLVQTSLSAACNCLHPVPKRYCRWLLMAHDRLGSDRLPFTLKLLATMLTVRLATVSEVTTALERARLVRYRRGELQILDRPGLEATACNCYRLIRDYFGR